MSFRSIKQRTSFVFAIVFFLASLIACTNNSVKISTDDSTIINQRLSFNQLVDTLIKESPLGFKDIRRGPTIIGNNGAQFYTATVNFNSERCNVYTTPDGKAVYTLYFAGDMDSNTAINLYNVNAGDLKVCLSDWEQKDSSNTLQHFKSQNYYRSNTEVEIFLSKDNDTIRNYDVGLRVQNIR